MSPEPSVLGEEMVEMGCMGDVGWEELISRRKMYLLDDLVRKSDRRERLGAEAMGGGDHTLETV